MPQLTPQAPKNVTVLVSAIIVVLGLLGAFISPARYPNDQRRRHSHISSGVPASRQAAIKIIARIINITGVPNRYLRKYCLTD